MACICPLTNKENREQEKAQESIRVFFMDEPLQADLLVEKLASIKGFLDLYSWYEGPYGLPRKGALFLKEEIFGPLFSKKQDVRLNLYSLKGWDFTKKVQQMPLTTPLGEAISRIQNAAVRSLYASSFFRYCEELSLDHHGFICQELAKKQWLIELSLEYQSKGKKVGDIFTSRFFEWLDYMDVSAAYSVLQYLEGYYLVQSSVKEALFQGAKKVNIAFALPNDESKYYQDFPEDIQKFLQQDFGKQLLGMEIEISFYFFTYGESFHCRPYLDKRGAMLKPHEIQEYFEGILPLQKNEKKLFSRYDIHHLQ